MPWEASVSVKAFRGTPGHEMFLWLPAVFRDSLHLADIPTSLANLVYIRGRITTGSRKPGSSTMTVLLTTIFSVFWIGCAPHPPFLLCLRASSECALFLAAVAGGWCNRCSPFVHVLLNALRT